MNAIKFRLPVLRPLPGEVTSAAISGATLPVKIEAARRAIATCQDLPELLRYKDAADGIAAAVKVMKHVAPEMVASANRMVKESIIRMGELLLRYNGRSTGNNRNGSVKVLSERAQIVTRLGIARNIAVDATRIAKAPANIRDLVLSDKVPVNIQRMRMACPPSQKSSTKYGDSMRAVMGGTGSIGLNRAFFALKHLPLAAFSDLTSEERKAVKTRITECVELLDEMDRRL